MSFIHKVSSVVMTGMNFNVLLLLNIYSHVLLVKYNWLIASVYFEIWINDVEMLSFSLYSIWFDFTLFCVEMMQLLI